MKREVRKYETSSFTKGTLSRLFLQFPMKQICYIVTVSRHWFSSFLCAKYLTTILFCLSVRP